MGYSKDQQRYIKDAIEIEDYNGFQSQKVYQETQEFFGNRFIWDIKTIQHYGAYSLPQIAQELCISERTLRRYLAAEFLEDIKISLAMGMFAHKWALYLIDHPTQKAKRRIRRRKLAERYNRVPVEVVKGS